MDQQQSKEAYQVVPIGYARQDGAQFFVEILPPYRTALKQMEHFSHVHIIWWANLLDSPEERTLLEVEPPYAPGINTGIFATRSPARPNPVAVTTVRILGVDHKAGIVRVTWHDAIDGTPVIDLKTYMPVSDRVREPQIPDWLSDWPEWMPESEEDWAPPG